MKVRITRPVIVSTPVGMKHFAPGLEVTVSEDEAGQIFRQKAGTEVKGVEAAPEPAPKPAKPRAKAKQENATSAPSPSPETESPQ